MISTMSVFFLAFNLSSIKNIRYCSLWHNTYGPIQKPFLYPFNKKRSSCQWQKYQELWREALMNFFWLQLTFTGNMPTLGRTPNISGMLARYFEWLARGIWGNSLKVSYFAHSILVSTFSLVPTVLVEISYRVWQ